MIDVASIVSRHGLSIDLHYKNQSNKVSYIALYKLLICFNSNLKQLYISNKAEHLSYKGGCGICGCTCIEDFKRRTGLGVDK